MASRLPYRSRTLLAAAQLPNAAVQQCCVRRARVALELRSLLGSVDAALPPLARRRALLRRSLHCGVRSWIWHLLVAASGVGPGLGALLAPSPRARADAQGRGAGAPCGPLLTDPLAAVRGIHRETKFFLRAGARVQHTCTCLSYQSCDSPNVHMPLIAITHAFTCLFTFLGLVLF